MSAGTTSPPDDDASKKNVPSKLQESLFELLANVPTTSEPAADNPKARAQAIRSRASFIAAAISGGLALPLGPLGLLTILPDLAAVWRIQARMVADIAGAYGKQAQLTREAMIWCLFRYAVGQLLRDIVVRVGERVLVRRASLRAMQSIIQKIGIRVTQKLVGRTISRWLPLIGAAGMAGYAYYDTSSVGNAAIELFGSKLEVDNNSPAQDPVTSSQSAEGGPS